MVKKNLGDIYQELRRVNWDLGEKGKRAWENAFIFVDLATGKVGIWKSGRM